MPTQKSTPILFLFYSVAIVTLLLLSALNIELFQSKNRVLGITTEEDTSNIFWDDFLAKNPNYIPGLIEVGRIDRVKQIDPNYLQP